MAAKKLAALLLGCAVSACGPTWTELGPKYAGRVSAIVATSASNVWVATPGGGVWKSTDGGATFTWAGNYALGDFTAVHLALDRNDPSRMYLRTVSGMLVSTDGAAHWTRTLYAEQGDTPYPYPSFCSSWPTCPPNADTSLEDPGPWAQTVFSPNQSVILTALPCQGLQYSTDNGNHFTQLWPFGGGIPQRNPDNCITSIAADDIDHRVWFTTMADNPPHIYRSSAGWTAGGPPMGLTWELVTNGIDGLSHAPKAIVWGGGSANRMMALVYTGSTHVPYLFDGTAWVAKPFNNGACVFWDARALVSGGTGNDFYVGGVTFAYTTNAGATWSCPALGQQYVDIRAIFPSASAQRLWIGGDQNALGSYALLTRYTWSPGLAPSAPALLTATGITSWQAYSIAKAPSSSRLLVGAQDINVACSDDGGATWGVTSAPESQAVTWAKTGGGNIVYSFGTGTVLHKATNAASAVSCAAMSWSDVSPSGVTIKIFSAPHTLAVDPLHESKVFALSGGRVLYSVNSGGNWTFSNFPLTTATGHPVGLTAVFVDEDGVVYVGTLDHGVYTCADTTHYCDGTQGAGTWTEFALNPGGPINAPWYVTAIAESNAPPSPRTFWIATSQGVYRRLAGSTTWTPVDALNLYPYSDVVVDPTCKTRIYTAMGYLDKPTRTRGGVHVSTDNGATWTSITAGFPLHNLPITQVLVDPANSLNIYASTYGRGAWRYTWGSLPGCAP
jgi:hypothetical protein